MALATSISLPTIRHPVVLAKWLSTLGNLSNNRIIAGLGPGSSRADYDAVGKSFEDRWATFDDAFRFTRAAVRGEPLPSRGHYQIGDLRLSPLPATPPEVWFGSWGSHARLRSLAAVADGWMASGYNTSPARFADARRRLDGHLRACGRDPAEFPDLIATMWFYVTEQPEDAQRVRELMSGVLRRDRDGLAAQLPLGAPGHCAELLEEYADVGAHQVVLWPIREPSAQLHRFHEWSCPGSATCEMR